MMQKWIDEKIEKPKSAPGTWSDPVIALSDAGLVYRLCYYNGNEDGSGCWQRTESFCNSASKRVNYWIPMPEFESGTLCHYDEKGMLRSPDGSRSIFDDVDE